MTNPINSIKDDQEKVTLLNHRGEPLKEIILHSKDEIMKSNMKDLEKGNGEQNVEEKKSDKKESKETVTKSLEFEKDTFKISSEGREEVTKESAKKNPVLQKFLDKRIKVKANATGDVVEFMEDRVNGELKCKKGEQIFIDYDKFIEYVAADKHCTIEEVESRYMMTRDELKEKMKDKPNGSAEYKKFFNEEVNGHLAGYWHPFNEEFYDIGGRSSIWLVGGNGAYFYQDNGGCSNHYRHCGFSGRLLKK